MCIMACIVYIAISYSSSRIAEIIYKYLTKLSVSELYCTTYILRKMQSLIGKNCDI